MKFAVFALLLSVAFVSAELAKETSVLSNLDNVESLINAEGLAAVQARAAEEMQSMSSEQHTELIQLASSMVAQGDERKAEHHEDKKDEKKHVKKDEGVRVSFKWTNIDVRNFLTWIVTQNDKAGTLQNIKLGSGGGDEHEGKKDGKKSEKLTEEEEKKLRHWELLRELDYTGPHDNTWFYRVRASGTMNSQNIRDACAKYNLKPVGALNQWNDGQQIDTAYDYNRYMSYMPHNLEDWQNWFNLGLYFYAGNANGGWPIQNIWGTHRWSGWGEDSRWTLCGSREDPKWNEWHKLHKKHHAHHGKRTEWAEKRYHTLTKLKEFETTGQVHGQMYFFKVPVSGQMVHNNILDSCLKYNLMPAQCYHGWSDGTTVDTPYAWGRYFSYPPHNIEGWENSFNNGVYFDCAPPPNGGQSLQNAGGTHHWSGGESNGVAMCVSFRNPFEEFDMLKELDEHKGDQHEHHHE